MCNHIFSVTYINFSDALSQQASFIKDRHTIQQYQQSSSGLRTTTVVVAMPRKSKNRAKKEKTMATAQVAFLSAFAFLLD